MKNQLILLYSFLGFCLGTWNAHAQDSLSQPTVVVKARAKGDKILLRWGVNDKFAWHYGNSYGYTIERTTILRDGSPLGKTEKVILANGVIKPLPFEKWESLATNNDQAAVVAQALYGEDFEMNDEDQANKLLKVIQESEELDRRFGFAMFAMDQDFEVAQYAGLGFVDTSVKSNEKYLYNIRSEVPKEIMDIAESGVFISPSEQVELPKPLDFEGYFYKGSNVLIWEYDAMLPFYTSYDLEKSTDGQHFEKVNQVPITKLADTKSSGISFTDSVAVFNTSYWYRLRGISVFDEQSATTEAVKLYAFKGITAAPFFKENEILSEKEVRLQWEFPKEQEEALKHFELLRADVPTGPFERVDEVIAPEKRAYTYTKLESVNYFKLKAVGNNGESILSSSNMVQPIDSVPPVKPVGLRGVIDSLGIVRLSWQKNTELDLKGYQVLRADRPNQEFSILNKHSDTLATYNDTINLTGFAKKVYYRIAALDQHYNQSEFSDMLELERPDMIPPTSPIFDSYLQNEKGIAIKWIKSSSDDVVKELLYRKDIKKDAHVWEKIFETASDSTAYYLDVQIAPESTYYYTLVALDVSGLESPPSPPLSVEVVDVMLQPKVKGLYAQVDRENKQVRLYWRYKEENVLEFLIYKKKEGQVYSLFRTATADEHQLTDTELHPNTMYHYGIKAVFKDGSVSGWSEIEVEY